MFDKTKHRNNCNDLDDVVKLLNEALYKAVEVGIEMFDRKERDLGARKIQPPKYIQRPKPAKKQKII